MTAAIRGIAAAASASLARFARDERGATVIEYGLIIALIFLAIIAAVRGYVNSTSTMYSKVGDAMQNP
ncbi:MAG TPA: Flp family type IVb pilin [Parvularculaceae bacterium]|nr:Flp family type IVb pilin [Parvularculaceae bacterium]